MKGVKAVAPPGVTGAEALLVCITSIGELGKDEQQRVLRALQVYFAVKLTR